MEPAALIADLGGTNARFSLVRDGAITDTQILRATQYSGLAEVIAAYLQAIGLERAPRRAALAVASPVFGDRIAMTNIDWAFSIREISERFGFTRLEVINDFVSVALAIPELPPDGYVQIGEGEPATGEAVAVLGPGTGLGVSTLVPHGDQWLALAGEGGHVTLPATNEREVAVIAHLQKRFGHVSAERVLSGMGLVNLYEAVTTIQGDQPRECAPADVTAKALDGGDRHCRWALDLFFSFLGSTAGNLALTVGARGGVYIAGGIVPRLIDELRGSAFRETFEAKGRLRRFVAPIPTYVIVEPLPAMLGLKGRALAGAG